MVSVIKNGTVYESDKNQLIRRDIWIEDGKIISGPADRASVEEIDAKGCYVLPALIDSHVHVNRENGGFGTNSDLLCIPNGVQTVIDAGSLGVNDMESFINCELPKYSTRVFALIYAASAGQNLDWKEDLQNINARVILSLYKKYPQIIKGLKIRYEDRLIGTFGLEPLKKCIEISERLQAEGFRCPVTVHLGRLGMVRLAEVLACLRPGDVLAHVFQSQGETILDENGMLRNEVKKARKKGIFFDFAHGRLNFTFSIIKSAGSQGFWPDLLGTDIHRGNVFRLPAFSAMNTVSMMNALGMPLPWIFRALTRTPAEIWNFKDEINRFVPGDPADISIIKEYSKDLELTDREGGKLTLQKVFTTKMTMGNGQVLYAEL